MAVLLAVSMTVAVLSAVSLALTWVTRRDMKEILDAFQDGHWKPCPDPNAAAVVTPAPSLAPAATGEPLPALSSVERRAATAAPPPSTMPVLSREVSMLDQTLASRGFTPASAPWSIELDDAPEGKATMRRRVEAAEDERERARQARARMETPAEEAVRFRLHCHTGLCSKWDCACACDSCLTARGETRDTFTPTQPCAPTIDMRIEHLWREKIAAALQAGKDARHCHDTLCMTEQHPVEACGCGCNGCELVLDLLIAAQREVTGRE